MQHWSRQWKSVKLIIIGQELVSDTLQRGETEAVEVHSDYKILSEKNIQKVSELYASACGRNQWFLSTEFGKTLSYLWISSPYFLASSNWSWCPACTDFPCKIETNNLNTVTFFSASSGREPPLFFSQEHSILENSYACVCCTQYDYMFNRKMIELEK